AGASGAVGHAAEVPALGGVVAAQRNALVRALVAEGVLCQVAEAVTKVNAAVGQPGMRRHGDQKPDPDGHPRLAQGRTVVTPGHPGTNSLGERATLANRAPPPALLQAPAARLQLEKAQR